MHRFHLKFLAVCLFISLIALTGKAQAQEQFILHSSLISAPDTVWVFTPSSYNANNNTYPAVYLLNGYGGSYHQWNDITDLQKLSNQFGFIIICPDGFKASWYLNSPIEKDHQYKSFFFKGLMPEINKRYRVNKKEVFISGLSMGGHGALYLFSQRPELFLSAGSISGVVNLVPVGASYDLQKLLGQWPEHRGRWKKHSVINNLKPIKRSGKKIVMSEGNSDPFLKMNKALDQKADSMGIDVTFITSPGGHNYKFWKKAIPYQLFFFHGIIETERSKR